MSNTPCFPCAYPLRSAKIRKARRIARPVLCPCTVPCRTVPPVRVFRSPGLQDPKRSASFNAGEGNFFARRPAALGRPRIPSRSSARAGRTPNVWLRPRALAPGAPLLMTGLLLRALVTRNRWLLARPAARATALAPLAGFRWFRAGRSRPFLERACHADRLVLARPALPRWSRSAGWSPLVPRWLL